MLSAFGTYLHKHKGLLMGSRRRQQCILEQGYCYDTKSTCTTWPKKVQVNSSGSRRLPTWYQPILKGAEPIPGFGLLHPRLANIFSV
mmetsp:Transcript_109871/g.190375  ORF Transcript_109871/g.190375 Transcript_109871/m.190375 type:complete len:87 (-) Transcript_109871:313-573(-)